MSRLEPTPRVPLRVGVLGWGVIGRGVGTALLTGAVPMAELAGISTRRALPDPPVPQLDPADLAASCDIVVEAAGQAALIELGPLIVGGGCDLLITSVGALADQDLRTQLYRSPGRYYLTSGAIGGLDLVGAARYLGPFARASLTTTKPGANLVQPWMDTDLVERLRSGTPDVCCFEGAAGDAAVRFPQSINIAATLAEAVGDWELVTVRVQSGLPGTPNRHVIETEGPAGSHRFEIANAPSPDNPTSSWVVASAVLRSLSLLRPSSGAIL